MSLNGTANIKASKMCAFCKHWYDPMNESIAPKAPTIGVWSYDTRAFKQCLKRGVRMKAGAGTACKDYEGKV